MFKNKFIYCVIGMFLLISCSNIQNKEMKLNLDHLMIKNNVIETLDSINVEKNKCKYIYVFSLSKKMILLEDSIETPILLNDLDSTLYMNSQSNNLLMLDLIKPDSTKIIISDKKLSNKDIISNKIKFSVF